MAKPVLLVVMDGVGFSKTGLGDAVTLANTPTLDRLLRECPNTRLKAHGDAVGLPTDDDMGNSEVGHNALGCGQIYSQAQSLLTNLSKAERCISLRLGRNSLTTARLTTAPCTSSVFYQAVTFTQISSTCSRC